MNIFYLFVSIFFGVVYIQYQPFPNGPLSTWNPLLLVGSIISIPAQYGKSLSILIFDGNLKIQKMCDEAFRIESYSLHHVTDKYKNQEMCNEPMCIRPISFYLIPDHLKTKRCVFKQLRNIHGMCSMTLIEKCVMIWWEAKTLAIFSWLVCDTIASKDMAFIIITGNYYYYR